jgi:hypothetical protein
MLWMRWISNVQPIMGFAMGPAKAEVIKLIQALPDNVTLKDILYHLYVREKVDQGLTALKEGRVLSQDEAERRVAEWVTSFRQSPV